MDDLSQRAEKLQTLSDKELEVMSLLCQGLRYQEVADRLQPPVTLGTVFGHYATICDKLGIRHLERSIRRVELAAFCPALSFVVERETTPDSPLETPPEPISTASIVEFIDPDPPILLPPNAIVLYDPIPIPIEEEEHEEGAEHQDTAFPRRNPWLRTAIGAGIGVVVTALIFVLVLPQVRGSDIRPEPTTIPPTLAPQVQAISPTAGLTQTPTATARATVTATTQPTRIPTPRPTATPRPAPGTVLYEANWSDGFDGWTNVPGWKFLNGMLLNDGSVDDISQWTIASYELSDIPDYAVEAQVQFVRRLGTNVCLLCSYESTYGIVVRVQGNGGYAAGLLYNGSDHAVIWRANKTEWKSLVDKGITIRGAVETHRVEVRGNAIRYFVDGGLVAEVVDNTYLSGGRVGLWSNKAQLTVHSFRIIAQ